MKKDSKYIKYLEWVLMLVLLLSLFIISEQIGFIKNLKPVSGTSKLFMLFGIFIMAFLVLSVHELGHLLTGLVNGFRFELFVIGPLGIKREDDKTKVYLNKNIGYYGGVAATSPIYDYENNAKIFAKILLAGPIASVLFAIACFAISHFIGNPLGIIFYTGGLISVAIFFATTIPSRTGMFFTDRKRYQRLVTPGKGQQVELAMLNIMSKFAKNNSYKNIDMEDINILVSDKLPFIKFYGLFNLVCIQLEHNGTAQDEILKTTKSILKYAETSRLRI